LSITVTVPERGIVDVVEQPGPGHQLCDGAPLLVAEKPALAAPNESSAKSPFVSSHPSTRFHIPCLSGRGRPFRAAMRDRGAGEQVTVEGPGGSPSSATSAGVQVRASISRSRSMGGERAQLGDLWIAVAMEDLDPEGLLAPARGGEQRVDQPGRVAGIARERVRPRWRDRFHPSARGGSE